MEKVKVLHMLNTMNVGGIENFLINMVRNQENSKVQIDFLLWDKDEGDYEKEILKNNSKIFKIELTQNPIKDIKLVKNFLDLHKYDVVHSHSLFYSGFFMLAAKLARIKIRISHMHSYSDNKGNSILRRLYRSICKVLMVICSTHCCACSEEAAKYGFGNYSNKSIIINDCIDVEKFMKTDMKKSIELKNKYKISEEDLVIGNVARLSPEKNQRYIIDIVERLRETNKQNIKCLIVGDGPCKEELQRLVMQKSLQENIVFTGNLDNINEVLKIIDIFVFPSMYEGFGIALLEAQAAGVYSIASKNVPQYTNLDIGLVKYLPIGNQNVEEWKMEIVNYKKKHISEEVISKALIDKRFDVVSTVGQLEKIYCGCDEYEK